MHREPRPVWLLILALAIGVAAAILFGIPGGGGGAGDGAGGAPLESGPPEIRASAPGLAAAPIADPPPPAIESPMPPAEAPAPVSPPRRVVRLDLRGNRRVSFPEPGHVKGEHETRIRVLDPRGRPVALASVRRPTESTSTDDEGLAIFVGLDPRAEFALAVEPRPSDPRCRAVLLPRWRPADSTIQLEADRPVPGRVLSPDGSRGPAAVIERFEGPRWWQAGLTTPDGSFVLRGLPSPPWTLRARISGTSLASPDLRVDDESAEMRLVLADPGTSAPAR